MSVQARNAEGNSNPRPKFYIILVKVFDGPETPVSRQSSHLNRDSCQHCDPSTLSRGLAVKILYHHRTQANDGCAVHITEMIAALRRDGHEVVVVAPAVAKGEPSAEKATGGLIATLRKSLPKAAFEALEFLYSGFAYFRLLRAVFSHRPDVLYERYSLFMPTGTWIRRTCGLPVLLEVNSPLLEERAQHGGLALAALAGWTERLSWKGADRVLPVTAVLARQISAIGVAEGRISVIANGINPQTFGALPKGAQAKAALGLEGKLVLGFTGFVRDWHGLDRVIDALPRTPQAHLLIVGDGPARQDLLARAQQMGVGDRVSFTGVLPHARIAAHVAAFDIALQPAVTAYASPLKLFEYLQMGRTILAPDQPNLREILTDGVNARLFNAERPAAFAEALDGLLTDPEERRRLAEGARATIARLGLTWDHNARRVVALAQTVLLASPRKRPGAKIIRRSP
ncbi:glycosyltransferase WbuB [Rhodospirillum rubrum]|nr:glycosyltransferase family 4 protein [Rhodospirillum rubrum]MBK1665957.1 glycosyltransferase WbuB [Rhodospirillum rubrum]MBK1678437.1 glycosyltransferase WbuB [Rhodospirillum rubrum]